MSYDDTDYLEARAEAEIELAQHATDPRVVQAHYDLATFYLDRVYPEEGAEERGPPPDQSH